MTRGVRINEGDCCGSRSPCSAVVRRLEEGIDSVKSRHESGTVRRLARTCIRLLRAHGTIYYKTYVHGDRQPCLVYQMGKVASSSVARTLRKQRKYNVFQVHRLNPDNIRYVKQAHTRQGHAWRIADIDGNILHQEIISKRKPCKIITLVREPIGRNMSAFFENLDLRGYPGGPGLIPDTADLVEEFLRKYPHEVPLEWFDKELRVTTGIDVYDYPFPVADGYQVIRNHIYDVLVMRYDMKDSRKISVINEFLELDIKQMENKNIGASKEYNSMYNKFKDGIRLPTGYIEEMLTSKYCRHFYSSREIDELYAKYAGREDAGG